ncbi:hypothetical protein NQ315_000934 [Exocentrus adspersus]|uniref:Uncharacterized protein n=1 Tax=Exocentrus adspersus TaxID=1586481 RepID=A0AAV8WEB2_9CUCU|nr:hypothetical protein NQ315_000934 [Exocentrus adspersus]
MAPKLFIDKVSPPCRAVLMCAKAIGFNLDVVEISLVERDHLKPEFIKLNPLHTVPVLDDNGFVLYDSHAIMPYLIAKYAKDKSLYPEDIQKRALIDQRLHFDSGLLFARYVRLSIPILMDTLKRISDEDVRVLNEAYGFFNTILEQSKYVAGEELSIADFSLLNTVINSNAVVPLDERVYTHIKAWKDRLRALPYYEIIVAGGDLYGSVIKKKLSS